MMALSMEQAERDMCGAADTWSLPGFEGKGGSVGFCLGGGLSVWAAATCPNIVAAVTFYYVMPHGKPDFKQLAGPCWATSAPPTNSSPSAKPRRSSRDPRRRRGASFHFYENAGHAFFNDTNRLGPTTARWPELAWERTLSFLREAPGG